MKHPASILFYLCVPATASPRLLLGGSWDESRQDKIVGLEYVGKKIKKGFDLASSGRSGALGGPVGTVKESLKNSHLMAITEELKSRWGTLAAASLHARSSGG